MTTLVTGAAGFIGFHTAKALLARGESVVGIDNLNDYYDVTLKDARLAQLRDRDGFEFDGARRDDLGRSVVGGECLDIGGGPCDAGRASCLLVGSECDG